MKYQGFKYPQRNQDGSPVQYHSTWTPGKKRVGVQGYRLELNGEYSPTIPKYTDAVFAWMRVNSQILHKQNKIKYSSYSVRPETECKIIAVLG